MTAEVSVHTAPLERKRRTTFFYKHIAPLERKIEDVNCWSGRTDKLFSINISLRWSERLKTLTVGAEERTTFFYKHIAPLERKIEDVNCWSGRTDNFFL